LLAFLGAHHVLHVSRIRVKTVVQGKQRILLSVRYLSIAAHKHHNGTEKQVSIAARRRGKFSLQSCVIEITYFLTYSMEQSPS
jgi:hypothetical protein